MRHIEESGVCSRAQMFLDRTGGILDGHVPTAEVDHTSAELPVGVVKWGKFWLRRCCGQINHSRGLLRGLTLFLSVNKGEAAN
jgi:hypothetical protein